MKEYIITQLDKEILFKMYYDGARLEEMYSKTEIPRRKIRSLFRRNNMDMVKRYTLNESYFCNIDSEKKAYWLGYIYCDGFVGGGKYNNIVLSSIDENIIDSFICDIEVANPSFVKKVILAEGKRLTNSFAKSTLYEARFSSAEMKSSLKKRNIFPNRKSTAFLEHADINRDLLKYVIFGFIDADAYASTKNGRRVVSLYSSRELVSEYEKMLKRLSLMYTKKWDKSKNCYYIRFSFSDEYTSSILDEYFKYTIIERKSTAPSLLKNSVE